MANGPETKPLQAFWRAVIRVDKNKINTWIAFRNSLAVALPLGIGIALGKPLGAVAVTTGALNVSYSDGKDPYRQRARRMLSWAVLGAAAVFIGSVTGSHSWLAVLVAAVWAFIAGLLVSVSTRAGDLGLNTLVALIVFAARGAMDVTGAVIAGGLVLAGGLLQSFFALLFWPVRAYEPERRAVGKVYLDLANELSSSSTDPLQSPLSSPSTQVQDTLTALGRDHSLEGERYRMLFDQADRIRMSTFVLHRLRSELQHAALTRSGRADNPAAELEPLLDVTAEIVQSVGNCLISNNCSAEQPQLMQKLQSILSAAHHYAESDSFPLAAETGTAIEVLAGQLRVIVTLTDHAIGKGSSEFDRQEASHPWRLQVSNWFGTLRANLDPRSPYFRHAVRLAACVAIGDGLGRMISWQRSYWIPMTIAVVLKPDFTTTFSRGILRLAGTFTGLLLATMLYHVFPVSAVSELLLVGVFTFALRSIGPANYGVFSTAVSGLIVFLIAETGISPKEVVLERAVNTVSGGVFALVAYALWPTWERTQVTDVIADMMDACRDYFRGVAQRFGREAAITESELDDERSAWRRARSNAEASVDRVSSEPRANPGQINCLTSMLASSHALVHAIMALEAALIQGQTRIAPAFENFANDVEFTLYFLASALRGSTAAFDTLPKLRQDHARLVEARQQFAPNDEYILLETDRLTTSLNTLREQVMHYLGSKDV